MKTYPFQTLPSNLSLNINKLLVSALFLSTIFTGSISYVQIASAVPVTATGTTPGVCNQEVSNSTGVTAVRLSGGDCLITFTNVGTVTWTLPIGITTYRVLIIGGGGGGGGDYGGGGGGGGFIDTVTTVSSSTTSTTIKVGAGGAGNAGGGTGTAAAISKNGDTSTIFAFNSPGGGGGGSPDYSADGSNQGRPGASGGGSSRPSTPSPGANGIPGLGNNGGGSTYTGTTVMSGGGGGAGAAGATGGTNTSSSIGGAGGDGRSSNITDSTVFYSGGGGAGTHTGSGTCVNGTSSTGLVGGGAAGGSGGGGAAGRCLLSSVSTSLGNAGANGTANLGGGGGGGSVQSGRSTNARGGSGGSGVVIVRYSDTSAPTYSSSSISSNGLNLTLTYSETLSATTAAPANFVVTVNSTETRTISSVSTSGSSITLALGSRIEAGQSVAVTYTDPTGGNDANAIQDLWGNDASTLNNQSITNTSNSSNDSAISLNGSNQHASASGAQVIPTSTASAFTVQAWIRQPASRSSGSMYQILSQGASSSQFYLKIINGSVIFSRNGYTAENTCSVGVPTEEWTHVAVVVGNTSQSCYINGSLAGSFTQSSTTAIGTTFAVGQYTPTGGEFFLGQIDEVKIWSDARTQVEIQSDLNSYGGTLADNLVAYYDFNELVGSKIYNRSTGGSNALDLTTVNSPTITSASIIETSTVQAYTVVKFMRTFLVASGGWTSPTNVNSISYSVVGAGGGGGAGGYNSVSGMGGGGGGGGGGGQVVSQTSNISPGALIPITVGQGGSGGITGGRSNSSWAGTHGRSGGSSSIVISGSTTTSAGGGFGLGGGFWGVTSPPSTACNNTRGFVFDGLSVYYIDGIGGRGGNSGSGNTGGRPYCDATTSTGLGGAGVGGAGNATATSNLTSVSNLLQSGGAGTTVTLSGTSIEYGTGGSGGGGEGGGSATPVIGASGVRPGMGGNGGAGSIRGNTSSVGAIGGGGAPGVVILRYITNTPTILTQPLSDTTTAGIVETFTVTTSAAPAPLTKSVQWQFTTDTTTGITGWTNVSSGTGGTTDTFTTVALTLSMNKYRFRAIVTFSDTSTLSVQETSTVAILTINPAITITSDTSTITRKYGDSQTVRTLVYSGGTTNTGAVGITTSHTVRGSFGTQASGRIVLDTSTTTAVFRVDTGTVVGSYVETITVTDFKGATATYTQRVVVNPADTLTVQADTLTATTYTGLQANLNETITVTGLVAGDSVSEVTYTYTSSTNYGPSTTKPTNAGTYTITPSALVLANNVDTSNYVWVDYRTSTFTINKARQDTLTVGSVLGVYETGTVTMQITTLGGSDTGTVTYAIASGGTATGCSVSSNLLTVTSAGTCRLVATKAATLNYLIAYSDTATITFTRFIPTPVQVQLYPSMIPLNQGNALETTTVTAATLTISAITRTGAGAYTITGTGFTNIDLVSIGGAALSGSNYTRASETTLTLSGVSSFMGPLLIRLSDGQESVLFQFDWS
jgi:uncharacterized repeat protein (TIGR02059 family)